MFKNRCFKNYREYKTTVEARNAFIESKKKLFDVKQWSALPGYTATFEVYNPVQQKFHSEIKVGYYIKISFSKLLPHNWVKITDIFKSDTLAFIKVRPARDPNKNNNQIAHFLVENASSTFKVEIKGHTIFGYEVGCDEFINNKGEQAGNRKIINTIIAIGGWLGIQNLQCNKLTNYLVHKTEP